MSVDNGSDSVLKFSRGAGNALALATSFDLFPVFVRANYMSVFFYVYIYPPWSHKTRRFSKVFVKFSVVSLHSVYDFFIWILLLKHCIS